MRIDSGLNSYSYQYRSVPVTAEKDDAAPETGNAAKGRSAMPSTFSSTLLSNQLASALWTVDGGRKSFTIAASGRGDDMPEGRVARQIEDAYREYAEF